MHFGILKKKVHVFYFSHMCMRVWLYTHCLKFNGIACNNAKTEIGYYQIGWSIWMCVLQNVNIVFYHVFR